MRHLIIVFSLLLLCANVYPQNVQAIIDKAKQLIDEEEYEEAYKSLHEIDEQQIDIFGDSCSMMYNYEKGFCLYNLDKFEEAIPCLNKSLLRLENMPHEDCGYLELIYYIGSCYNHLKQYENAEKYFRRVIIRGNVQEFKCAIKATTYSELAELYSMMGKSELADICTSRIATEMTIENFKDIEERIDDLYDLYDAYEKQGKLGDAINTLRKILSLIDEKKGKNNDDYLTYSFLLASLLRTRDGILKSNDEAKVFKEMIEIGKNFKTYKEEVCIAYEEYLRYLASRGDIDSIDKILPSAIKYYTSANFKDKTQRNLYEIVGLGLCDAKLYEEGVRYLEMKWNDNIANSIRALDYLGAYYFFRMNNPEKALSYYKQAESQIEGGVETGENTRILILEYLVLINQRLGNTQEAIRYSKKLEPFMRQKNDNDYYSRFLIDWAVECVNSGSSGIWSDGLWLL